MKRQKVIQELFAWQQQQKVQTENKISSSLTDDKARAVVAHLNTIDAAIQKSAPEWETDKINNIDLAILRLATFELLFEATEPAKVIIDEAVELGKEYGTETSPSFINGTLGKILKDPERLKKIISAKLGVEENLLSPEKNFASDLNITSLEVSDLVTFLEKEYQITIEKDAKFPTVGDLFSYIEDQIE